MYYNDPQSLVNIDKKNVEFRLRSIRVKNHKTD